MNRGYAIVVRRAARNFSADCPDLPGCVATGRTIDETLRRMQGAIAMHIAGLKAQRLRVPRPVTPLSTLVRRRGGGNVYTVLRVAA